jgi:hypothetical protein
MTTTRKVVARKVAPKKTVKKSAAPQRPTPGKNVEVKVEVTIMVSTGPEDTRSIEEIREDIKADLKDPNGRTRAKLVTNMGGYYLVDGRVCLPDDYDPSTRGFKKGAHPPLWAMGPDERAVLARIEREKSRPGLAQNPANLRTTQETDALHKQQERRPRTPAEALHDLHENSEWGKNKKRELAEREAAKKESASEDEDEFTEDEFEFEEEEPFFEDDAESDEEEEDDPEAAEDDFEAEWDEDDPMNDEVADEALESQTSSALAKLKNGTKTRKVTTVAKPVTKKKVVRRR